MSAGFTGATYLDQHAANEHQLQVDQAAAAAAERHDAEQVSYWLEGSVPHTTAPEIVIENRSIGPIRDVILKFPQPVQGCSTNCQWEAFDYVGLPDIPPCSLGTTAAVADFIYPKIGSAGINGSFLSFTDPNGKSWVLYGGESRPVEEAGYKAPVGFTWTPHTTFTPIVGCS